MRSLLSGIWVAMVLIVAGCGGERTIGEGRLQKRMHQHGWHLDLHSSSRGPHESGTMGSRTMGPRKAEIATAFASAENRAIEWASVPPLTTTAGQLQPMEAASAPISVEVHAGTETLPADQDEPENLMPRKKLNPLAIPAFVLALGVLYLGFFTTNTFALVVAIALTLAVSGISLARMRTREQGGKGFALAGLMIGVIATIFTAIAIAAFGFD